MNQFEVTFGGNYRTLSSSADNGYINPAGNNDTWWVSNSISPLSTPPVPTDGNIQLNNGDIIQVSTLELNALGIVEHIATAHESLASLGIVIQEIVTPFDLNGNYYFSIINTNPQSIQINVSDPIAYISYVQLVPGPGA